MSLRSKVLIAAYKTFPFSLKGDLQNDDEIEERGEISCIINFYGRINLLEGILYSLVEQDLSKDKFEVLLVEDKGGTESGRIASERFKNLLDIKYHALPECYGKMGYSRNYGFARAKGKYVLFLDDDTVLPDENFLSTLLVEFESSPVDAIVPHGSAGFYMIEGRYGYHEPYFPTNRCMAYRSDVLRELGGFVSDIVGQEDVELVVRFTAAGKRYQQSRGLRYFHPPLIVSSFNKPGAVGYSFARLRRRYPFVIWMMLLANASRHFPLLLMPLNRKWIMQGKFSLGFLLGIYYAVKGNEARYQ